MAWALSRLEDEDQTNVWTSTVDPAKAMDLVNEQDIIRLKIGQDRD